MEYLPVTNESGFSDFSYLINNNFYDFRVFLVSFDGRMKRLTPPSIKSLVIEDNIDNPFHSGYAVLDNKQDNIESNYKKKLDQTSREYYIPNSNLNYNEETGTYLFNGDCRDILSVTILPKLTEGSTNTRDENVFKYFLLKFDFVIYNTEEIDDGTQEGKLKKIYFHEWDYEVLRERNSYFSTSNYLNLKSTDIQDLSNSERRISTGAALSAAITEGLNVNGAYKPEFELFETGSTSLFFSSPGDFKYIDSINYILDRHLSDSQSNFSPCILQLERYPKKYTLRSLHNIFSNAVNFESGKILPGNEFLENFKIAGFKFIENTPLPTFNVE